MPSATILRATDGSEHVDYDDGIPLGYIMSNGEFAIYNHWYITVRLQYLEDSKSNRIVGFEVEPRSYAHGLDRPYGYGPHEPMSLNKLFTIDSDAR